LESISVVGLLSSAKNEDFCPVKSKVIKHLDDAVTLVDKPNTSKNETKINVVSFLRIL
jgi:hypothetical protein